MAKPAGNKIVSGDPVEAPALTGPWLDIAPPKHFSGVTLVHFWTYSCLHCILSMPQFRKWSEAYGRRDFLVVGVHTPEFEFEKNPANVREAVRRLGISWPVILDNDRALWSSFANRIWPSKYVIDREDKIAFAHFGPGSFDQTERVVRRLLGLEEQRKLPRETRHPTIPDAYVGFEKGVLANAELRKNAPFVFQPPFTLRRNELALSGEFIVKPECAETQRLGAALNVNMRGGEAHLVLEPVGEEAVVEVLFKKSPLRAEIRGADVDQASTVAITEPRPYHIVSLRNNLEGILTVRARYNNFRAYVFRFADGAD